MRRASSAVVVSAAVILGVTGCSGHHFRATRVVTGGSPSVGKDLIHKYGCGSCHEIPGVKGANGLVGPPLLKFGRRQFIAGELANTPDNLIRWITDPKAVEPGTDMPKLGVSDDEARNIAAYLEQLG
jgi:cytochrome c